MLEKSRPHKRQGNFLGFCGLGGIISCSSIAFVDVGDIDEALSICWCCWASNAAWWGFETIAINAPVVGSINGGVVADDDVDNAKDLYAESSDRFATSPWWPLIPGENIPVRWCLGEWELNRSLGEIFSVGWDIWKP